VKRQAARGTSCGKGPWADLARLSNKEIPEILAQLRALTRTAAASIDKRCGNFLKIVGLCQQFQPHLFNRGAKVRVGHPCSQPRAKLRFLSQAGGFIFGQRARRAQVWSAKFHALKHPLGFQRPQHFNRRQSRQATGHDAKPLCIWTLCPYSAARIGLALENLTSC
jgi:hypothetical protein